MRMAACTLLAVLLSGCLFMTPKAPDSVSESAVVLAVPVLEQDGKFECGNASLSMLLAYYAHTPDAGRVTELKSKAFTEQGLSGQEMLDFLDAEGFEAVLFSGDLSHEVEGAYYHLDRRRPLLVCLSNDGEARHFVLVTGYDPELELIYVQDPVRGALRFSGWEFDVFWKRCDRFCLLAVPRRAAGN